MTVGSRLPHFLIIGACKSGTTSLYDDLARHPDGNMPHDKEPAILHKAAGDPVRARSLWSARSSRGDEAAIRVKDPPPVDPIGGAVIRLEICGRRLRRELSGTPPRALQPSVTGRRIIRRCVPAAHGRRGALPVRSGVSG